MRPFDLLRDDRTRADPSRFPERAQRSGDWLCADLPYVNDREAETISGIVKAWREMPHDEYAAALRGLSS
jgi:hypothetical protein